MSELLKEIINTLAALSLLLLLAGYMYSNMVY